MTTIGFCKSHFSACILECFIFVCFGLNNILFDQSLLHYYNMGPDPLPEKSQKIGFLSNTGPVVLKNYKATKPAFNVGPFIVIFGSSIPPHQLKKSYQT